MTIFFENDEDLHVSLKPLTQEEKKWMIRLAKVLNNRPKSNRFDLLTHGDCSIQVIPMDNSDFDLEDGKARMQCLVFADILTNGMRIHGVSG